MTSQNNLYIFYDLETTGIDTLKDRICQLGAIVHVGDVEILRYESFVNPSPVKMHPRAAQVTGIAEAQLVSARGFKEVWGDFISRVKSALCALTCGPITHCKFIGHNNDTFDNVLLQAEFQRVGFQFDWSYITQTGDTLKAARIAKKSKQLILNNLKLGTIYEHITGHALENAHTALADCDAVVKIFEQAIVIRRLIVFVNWSSVNDILKSRLEKRGLEISSPTTPTPTPTPIPIPTQTDPQREPRTRTRAEHESTSSTIDEQDDSKRRKVPSITTSLQCQLCNVISSSFFKHLCLYKEL